MPALGRYLRLFVNAKLYSTSFDRVIPHVYRQPVYSVLQYVHVHAFARNGIYASDQGPTPHDPTHRLQRQMILCCVC